MHRSIHDPTSPAELELALSEMLEAESPPQMHSFVGLMALLDQDGAVLLPNGLIAEGYDCAYAVIWVLEFLGNDRWRMLDYEVLAELNDLAIIRRRWRLLADDVGPMAGLEIDGTSLDVAARDTAGHWRFMLFDPLGFE